MKIFDYFFGKWEKHAITKDKLTYGSDIVFFHLWEHSRTGERKCTVYGNRLISEMIKSKYSNIYHAATLWSNGVSDDESNVRSYFHFINDHKDDTIAKLY